jgi:hypothetical protein
MNRRDFLKGIGITSIAGILPAISIPDERPKKIKQPKKIKGKPEEGNIKLSNANLYIYTDGDWKHVVIVE